MLFNIRFAQKDDFIQISDLICKLYSLHTTMRPDLYKMSDYTLSKTEFFESINRNSIIVAEIDKKVVALLRFYKKIINDSNNRFCIPRKICYVNGLIVDEKYRNIGIATQLLNKLKNVAVENEMTAIELQVETWNNAAVNFYKKNDFKSKSLRMEFEI